MPVGYGYSADTQPVFIDWAKISKDFTDQVQARKDIAQTEKENILQNRKDFNQTLIDRPSGQNEVANSVMSATATQIKDTSVNNFNRYKNKEITLQQYKNFENNLNSGTDMFFDAVKNYNQNFNEFATRAQNGSASQVEVFMHELMQNYTDFGRIQVNVNPANGSLIFAQLDKDGKVTDKTLDVSQIGYFSKYKRDKYNINAAVGTIAQGLGNKFIQDSKGNSLKYQGMMYDELITNDTLMKGLDLEVQSLIDQDSELESVLADSMGYKIVTEKTDNPNELYFNQDANVFEITDGQKQAAFQHVRDKLARAITVERKAAPDEKPRDKVRETIDTINAVRLAGGVVDKQLFTSLLKNLGLDDIQIAKTFPDGIDDNSFSEFNTDLTGFVSGITADTLNQAVSDGKPGALTNQLRKLRQLGIGANYQDASKLDRNYAKQNNQPEPLGFISINALNGDDENAFRIPLTEGLDILDLYDEIVSQIPIYASPADIAFRLEMISDRIKSSKNRAPGDILFMPKN